MERTLQKLYRIFTGWYLMLTFHDTAEAKRRRGVCKTCEFRKGIVCGVCGCPLKALSLVEEKLCDKGKW
jgi:hypothetical protein